MMSIADPLLSTVNVFKTENREKNLADITDWNYDFQTVCVNSPFSILNLFASQSPFQLKFLLRFIYIFSYRTIFSKFHRFY